MWQGTGTLIVRSGAEECRLYFMGGTLYHAEGPGGVVGQPAVDIAMEWTDFKHEFDRESRLPTIETIGEEEVANDAHDLARWNRRESEDLRQRAAIVFAFLIVAGLVMIWLFSQRA